MGIHRTKKRAFTLGAILVAAAFAFMFWWSWGTWCDPVVDFGRELYVPWRLAAGEVLYRDINYFNGPLSPYLHALVFRALGASLHALVWFNAAVALSIAAMIFYLGARFGGAIAAISCALAFVIFFAFAQYTTLANYNYICPYSYELTHGIALSLLGLICIARLSDGRARWSFVCGLILGLIALTKAEVFLAALAGFTVGIVFSAIKASRWRIIWLFAVGSLIAPAVALLLLRQTMPVHEALLGLAGSWKYAGNSSLRSLSFFRTISGTADLEGSLLRIATAALFYAALLAVAWACAFLENQRPHAGRLAGCLAALALLCAGWCWNDAIPWDDLFRPLPLVLLVVIAGLLRRIIVGSQVRSEDPLLLATCFQALVLLGRIILNVRIMHYGFALAMPAVIFSIALALGMFALWIAGDPIAARIVIIGLLLALAQSSVRSIKHHFGEKRMMLGAGADAFRADARGGPMQAANLWLQRNTSAHQSVVVMPEGLMLNFLARRINPTKHLNFSPPALSMFGEQRMAEDLRRNSPDFIVLVHVDASDYDAPMFGRDYGRSLQRLVTKNYRLAALFGSIPFTSEKFGAAVYAKKT